MDYPLGVRRDGSYYTRIEWTTHTESDPTFWVCNLIRDDIERNGGTWGTNTRGPANVVLSFFGVKEINPEYSVEGLMLKLKFQ